MSSAFATGSGTLGTSYSTIASLSHTSPADAGPYTSYFVASVGLNISNPQGPFLMRLGVSLNGGLPQTVIVSLPGTTDSSNPYYSTFVYEFKIALPGGTNAIALQALLDHAPGESSPTCTGFLHVSWDGIGPPSS